MNLRDITTEYKEYLSHQNLEKYEEAYPALFKHYFSFWGNRALFTKTLEEKDVDERVWLIRKHLPNIERALIEKGFITDSIEITLFVGQNCTNGHAFLDNNKFIVWIPIEMYSTETQVKVFLTHEIIHALHYTQEPKYYFLTKEEKYNPIRQLITEGIATFITKEIMKLNSEKVLWADFLSTEDAAHWIKKCEEEKQNLCKKILSNENAQELFEANNPNDIFKFRAGYYLGLYIIEKIVRKNNFTVTDITQLPKEKLDNFVQKELENCA